ncbi:MAG TPA: NAD-dependent epimerase/dehydratase family protein [Lentzea sp.]
MSPERVVVTGGAGFLGSHVCDALLRDGAQVVCVDDFRTGSRGNVPDGVGIVVADVSRPLDVPGPVDLIVHLACPASPADYLRMPVGTLRTGGFGTYHVLELARRKDARVVIASTSEVYGDPEEHPQRETYWGHVNPIGPRSVYDEAKRFGEAMTVAFRAEHGVDAGIVRIFNTYGPRMRAKDGRMIPTFLTQALAGEPLTVHGDGLQTRSLCYVSDLVRGLLAMARSDHPGPINLGNPAEVTVLDVARKTIEVTGSASVVRHVESMTDDPRRRRPDISLAEEILDWQPTVPLDEGLRSFARDFAG